MFWNGVNYELQVKNARLELDLAKEKARSADLKRDLNAKESLVRFLQNRIRDLEMEAVALRAHPAYILTPVPLHETARADKAEEKLKLIKEGLAKIVEGL